MTGLSPRRKLLKVIGLAIIIGGIALAVFATFFMEAASFRIQAGPDEALGVAEGETRFAQFAAGFVGIVLVYVGYRVFRFIPYAEREREQVTELDL
jgi:amino acid transporter